MNSREAYERSRCADDNESSDQSIRLCTDKNSLWTDRADYVRCGAQVFRIEPVCTLREGPDG
jgi:hypothetical protein